MRSDTVFSRSYSAGEASRIAGVSYTTLNHWVSSGFFKPTRVEATGRSTCRAFDFSSLVALAVINQLVKQGSGTKELSHVARFVRGRNYEIPPRGEFLVVRDNFYPSFKTADGVLEDMEKLGEDGGSVLVVHLRRIIGDVEKEARRSDPPRSGKARAAAVG